jgi:peptidyl-prolyl cis-trans isomerase C
MNRLLTASALSVSLLTGCSQPPAQDFRHNRAGGGTPVATWGKDSVTAEELQQRFSEMSPFARARYQTPEQRKEYVEGLARFELLAAEAQKRGLQNDPEVVETAKKVMVQRLIQKEFEEKAGKKLEDAELQAFYEKHRSDYVKPEMLRLSDIFLPAAKDAPERAAQREKALELRGTAATAPTLDFQAFAKLAREHNQDGRTKPLDGDMRFLSVEELTQQYGTEVATAAQQLKAPGELSEVVETDKGFYVLKLQARQAPLDLSLEQVKTTLQSRILYERKTAAFSAFLDTLKTEQQLKVDDAALQTIQVDLKKAAQEPKGPTPGFIPAPNAAMVH